MPPPVLRPRIDRTMRPAPIAVAVLLPLVAQPIALVAQEPAAAPPKIASEQLPWFDLFDGATLSGWVTKGGRYDGKAIWTVEDGAIVGRVGPGKAGGLIYTDRDWHSFDLQLQTMIDWPFDSGVFVRMSPHGKGAQLTLDWRPDGEIGGVYSDGWLQHCPQGAALFHKAQWNDVRVRCTGRDFRLQMWINGEPLTDYRLPPGTEGYAPTGKIGLQVHPGLEANGQSARFRAIRMRELPVFDVDEFDCDDEGFLTANEGSGWKSLLGDDLSQWRTDGGDGSGFAYAGGVLEVRTQGDGDMLWTREEYGDFELRLDFQMARGANSGVYLRGATEVQLLDDFHWESDAKTSLEPWQFTGSLYAAVAPGDRSALYPTGRWNSLQIRCEGSRMRCELNGVELWDVDTDTVEAHKGEPFRKRARSGAIGLQRHAPAKAGGDAPAWLRFKNVFVRPLGQARPEPAVLRKTGSDRK